MAKTKASQTEPAPQLIPLNRLKKSPRNARRVPHTKEEIAALAASIKAHGLLQNPVVEPELDGKKKPTGYFLVTIGEGRRQALLLRAKRKEIKPNHPVHCVVDADHDPFEISIAENAVRAAMHPADEFTAFYALHTGKGMSAEDIGARFGITAAVVRQRLKLAAVSPALIEVYREGSMTLDQLTAFAVCDDIARQERVWKEAGHHARRDDILAALTQSQVPHTDPRAIFVGAKAYQAAGGAIVQDLFAELDGAGSYFADAELLFRLASEKLEKLAIKVRAEGWKWVEVMPRLEHVAVASFRRIYPAPRELSEAEQDQLATLEAEYEALDYDNDDESAATVTRLEEAIAALQGEPEFEAEGIARAGAIVTIAYNGIARIERGFVRPEDDIRSKKLANGDKPSGPAPLSEKLLAELTAYRTAALQAALGENGDVALTAVTHSLALSMCFNSGIDHSCLQLHGRAVYLASVLPDIEKFAPAQRIVARHERVSAALPEDPATLWDTIAALTQTERLGLLAHCLAFTVDAVQRPGRDPFYRAHADQLAQALTLDLAEEWTPTAANYLGRVAKERILEAVREAVSPEAASNIASLKKGAMADAAEQRLAGLKWLPEILRTPLAETPEPSKRPAARRMRRAPERAEPAS